MLRPGRKEPASKGPSVTVTPLIRACDGSAGTLQWGYFEEVFVTMTEAQGWSRCNICKKPIAWGGLWYKCSVSTCNKKRLPLHFCSPDCWDAHLPDANHRGPLCIEERAPYKP